MDEKLLAAMIQKIWPNLDHKGMAIDLSKALTSLQMIKAGIRINSAAAVKEIERHHAAMNELAASLAEIRGRCPHLTRTFQGDPSGGRDSSESCDWCGGEFR